MIYRHLSVDNKCDNRITEIVTQREHGVTLFEIKCLNNGYGIDLTDCVQAQFYGEKSDGHKVGVKCDFNEDKTAVLLPLILQMTTAEGLLNGVLELSFESGNIRFSGINFKVVSAPDDTKIESKDEFTIFERCLLMPERDGKAGQVLTLGSDGKNVWSDVKGGSGGTSDYEQLENKPSINGVEINGNKSLVDLGIKQNYTADDILFSDGETFQQKFDSGELKGQQGERGEKGDVGERGQDGKNGVDGTNGKDGIGISKSEINTSGELVITYSDGNSVNLGKVTGETVIKGYELLNKITLEENVTIAQISIPKNIYKLLLIAVIVPATEKVVSLRGGSVNQKGTASVNAFWELGMSAANKKSILSSLIFIDDGIVLSLGGSASILPTSQLGQHMTPKCVDTTLMSGEISGVRLFTVNLASELPVNTIIRVWGVLK